MNFTQKLSDLVNFLTVLYHLSHLSMFCPHSLPCYTFDYVANAYDGASLSLSEVSPGDALWETQMCWQKQDIWDITRQTVDTSTNNLKRNIFYLKSSTLNQSGVIFWHVLPSGPWVWLHLLALSSNLHLFNISHFEMIGWLIWILNIILQIPCLKFAGAQIVRCSLYKNKYNN